MALSHGATRASVVVPTHRRAKLLALSVASACRQTEPDLEIHIVGDGVDDATREQALNLCAADPRVQFHDLPKAPRLGEAHRHAIVNGAGGEIICYLADDDLWFPDHVEICGRLLDRADFVTTGAASIVPGGTFHLSFDVGADATRAAIIAGEALVTLSCMAHTAGAYTKLPTGWHTTPPGAHTMTWFARQWLSESWVRARSTRRITLLQFATGVAGRELMSEDERVAENQPYLEGMGDVEWRERFWRQALDHSALLYEHAVNEVRQLKAELQEPRQRRKVLPRRHQG